MPAEIPARPTLPARLRLAWRQRFGWPGTLAVALLLLAAALAPWPRGTLSGDADPARAAGEPDLPPASASRQARDLETLRAQAALQGLQWLSATAHGPSTEASPPLEATPSGTLDWQVELQLAGERDALRQGIAALLASLPHARIDQVDLRREDGGERWQARVQITLRYRR